MHVLDAFALTVHAYPGGAESLAPRLGMSAGILRNKANVNNTTNHATLADANDVMTVTGDHQILHALAHAHGYVLHRCDDLEQEREQAKNRVDELVLQLMHVTGNFAGTIQEARADGIITSNEAKDTSNAGITVQKTVVDLVAAIQDQVRLG